MGRPLPHRGKKSFKIKGIFGIIFYDTPKGTPNGLVLEKLSNPYSDQANSHTLVKIFWDYNIIHPIELGIIEHKIVWAWKAGGRIPGTRPGKSSNLLHYLFWRLC